MPAIFEHEVGRVAEVVTSRGLVCARLGRLAVGAWSAGYGGVLRILSYDSMMSKVSGVLLADAGHSNLKGGDARFVDLERMAPFVGFAQEATKGDEGGRSVCDDALGGGGVSVVAGW